MNEPRLITGLLAPASGVQKLAKGLLAPPMPAPDPLAGSKDLLKAEDRLTPLLEPLGTPALVTSAVDRLAVSIAAQSPGQPKGGPSTIGAIGQKVARTITEKLADAMLPGRKDLLKGLGNSPQPPGKAAPAAASGTVATVVEAVAPTSKSVVTKATELVSKTLTQIIAAGAGANPALKGLSAPIALAKNTKARKVPAKPGSTPKSEMQMPPVVAAAPVPTESVSTVHKSSLTTTAETRLISTIERIEQRLSTDRVREVPAAVVFPARAAAAQPTPVPAAASARPTSISATATSTQRTLPPPAPGVSGLRRLATLAEPTSQGPEPPATQRIPERAAPAPTDTELAARLAGILRAEAERHGIDVGGVIR